MEYVYIEKLKGEKQIWRQLLHSTTALNDTKIWGFLGGEKKKCLHRVELKVMQMLNSVWKQKNMNTSPYLIDQNKGDVVMRRSGFMNNSSETKPRILLA